METLFGTQLLWLTLLFIIIESLLFAVQIFHLLNRPQDKRRLWYLILLAILIGYNISQGLMPNPSWRLDVRLQNMTVYFFAYLMGAYIPFYFYKSYRLKRLRFHATWGVCFFILLPYLAFDLAYLLNSDLVRDREWTVVIPAAYGLIVLAAMLRAVLLKYKDTRNKRWLRCELAVWCAVLPWEAMSVFAFHPAGQWVKILLANLGWLTISFLQLSRAIRRYNAEHRQLLELTRIITPEEYETKCRALPVSERELDVVLLFRGEPTTQQIADKLFISELTVKTHITSILKKTGYPNRKELLKYLLTPPGSNDSH